jgi:dienelactone hydrolase
MLLLHYNCLGQAESPSIDSFLFVNSKTILDTSVYGKWPSIGDVFLTNNGKYCAFIIDNKMLNFRRLVLQGTENNWCKESTIKGTFSITSNCRKVAWINGNDSLCIVSFGEDYIFYIPDVSTFLLKRNDIVCLSRGQSNRSTAIDLRLNVKHFRQSECECSMSISEEPKFTLRKGYGIEQEIYFNDTHFNKGISIWKGNEVKNIISDHTGNRIAFVSDSAQNTLWYYKSGMRKAVILETFFDSSFIFSYVGAFSLDGERITINLLRKEEQTPKKGSSVVNIWDSYFDRSMSHENILNDEVCTLVIRLSDHKLIGRFSKDEWVFMPKLTDSVALIRRRNELSFSNRVERFKFLWYVLSLKSGKMMVLDSICENAVVELSPCGKYVIYYDILKSNYFVYETSTGHRRNITGGINEQWKKDVDRESYGRYIGAWEVNDNAVFVHGQRDIWKLDPAGGHKPINLTNGYGKRNNVVFFLDLEEYSRRSIRKKERLILTAFNMDTKDNGFYGKRSDKGGNPDSLFIGPYIFDITDNPNVSREFNYSPIRALRAKMYIVRRMSAKEAPNLFCTSDFRSFRRLSDLHPEKDYNWYSTELLKWRSKDGRTLKGILYKPENFSSAKKYPVIFYFYEKMTDGLNAYLKPEVLVSGCAISIPYYVSNGYLVFCPDISYKNGDPMNSAYEAVVSGAHYLSEFSFVDYDRMGLQGCSWGGIQTNFLITHSDIFAAVCSASGLANWVSGYLGIEKNGDVLYNEFENGQLRVNGTLWDKPHLYIENSAVFNTDKVTTPLLLMHTKSDETCSFSNIVEFFTGLRRLGRKSWMLVYEGNHGVFGSAGTDFSIRMKQFFDHYLQNKLAPRWMTQAIPAMDQTYDNGLELDSIIRTPGKGINIEDTIGEY